MKRKKEIILITPFEIEENRTKALKLYQKNHYILDENMNFVVNDRQIIIKHNLRYYTVFLHDPKCIEFLKKVINEIKKIKGLK